MDNLTEFWRDGPTRHGATDVLGWVHDFGVYAGSNVGCDTAVGEYAPRGMAFSTIVCYITTSRGLQVRLLLTAGSHRSGQRGLSLHRVVNVHSLRQLSSLDGIFRRDEAITNK